MRSLPGILLVVLSCTIIVSVVFQLIEIQQPEKLKIQLMRFLGSMVKYLMFKCRLSSFFPI